MRCLKNSFIIPERAVSQAIPESKSAIVCIKKGAMFKKTCNLGIEKLGLSKLNVVPVNELFDYCAPNTQKLISCILEWYGGTPCQMRFLRTGSKGGSLYEIISSMVKRWRIR